LGVLEAAVFHGDDMAQIAGIQDPPSVAPAQFDHPPGPADGGVVIAPPDADLPPSGTATGLASFRPGRERPYQYH